jgi:hypothetical protein
MRFAFSTWRDWRASIEKTTIGAHRTISRSASQLRRGSHAIKGRLMVKRISCCWTLLVAAMVRYELRLHRRRRWSKSQQSFADFLCLAWRSCFCYWRLCGSGVGRRISVCRDGSLTWPSTGLRLAFRRSSATPPPQFPRAPGRGRLPR